MHSSPMRQEGMREGSSSGRRGRMCTEAATTQLAAELKHPGYRKGSITEGEGKFGDGSGPYNVISLDRILE